MRGVLAVGALYLVLYGLVYAVTGPAATLNCQVRAPRDLIEDDIDEDEDLEEGEEGEESAAEGEETAEGTEE